MKKRLLSLFLLFLFPIQGNDWALKDAALGWNTPAQIRHYFHHSEPQTQWAWEALSRYRIRGDEHVLDFGSGDGKLSALISYMVPGGKVTGVDVSEQMVRFAAKMFPYPNLTFQQLSDVDFSEAHFPEKFDLVTSFCVFHVVPNPLAVLRRIHAAMSPQGHLVMTWTIGRNPEFYRAVSEEMEKRGWTIPAPTDESRCMRDPETIGQVLSSAGFELSYFQVVDTRFPFSTKKEMAAWFKSVCANWNIPEERQKEFSSAVADRLVATPGKSI